jgi:TRAP-type mannitol/chloroaromatic compound transport system substrate-binding protein
MQKHVGVRYRYADPLPRPDPARSPHLTATPEALAALPEELRAMLEQAVLTTNPDAIEQAISHVHSHDVTLAQALMTLAEEFAYAHILALLQAGQEHYAP